MMMRPALPSVSEIVIRVTREIDAHIAQTKAIALAMSAGCSRRTSWEYAIAVSEAATNMFKHAGKGVIQLRINGLGRPCLELEAIDRGPGIANLTAMISDGFSEDRDLSLDPQVFSRRGLGCGLGAIDRLMDELEISSEPASGTVLRARKHL